MPGHRNSGRQCVPKGREREIFLTYSVYGRGLDMFLTTYHYLDLVPKRRGQYSLSFIIMKWPFLHKSCGA
jgi:predicted dithiol-disulfide oxidoreductase (DUF899 family)